MTPAQLDEVWSWLDREQLAKITRQGPEPVFATISGAHLYGFASAESDVDLRGAFLLPARELLGLSPPAETITIDDESSVDLDWVAHDVRKFARMMTEHNGYVLEQLYSPLVVVTTPAHEERMQLGKGCITRPTARHYLGFFRGRLARLSEPDPTVKHLLYAYRVLLTGIHMMQTGEVVANVCVLNEHFRLGQLDELVTRKREGTERMPLSAADISAHTAVLSRLKNELERARDASTLPREATTTDALSDFVVRLRLDRAR